jgi:short-subunit dehydrogenase
MTFRGKTYWLIGASEGLGAALARAMAAEGANLILSARSADKLDALAAELPNTRALPCDVASRDSIEAAARDAGQIDGMIWLAGVYWPMTAQAVDAAQAEAMADVNFTGAVRAVAAVLPQMVARDAGHIVITGSLSGFRGLPGAIGYAASKAGVMVLAESLHCDLHRTGVRVQLANPGFIKTRLTEKNDFAMPFLMTPEQAAGHMMTLMKSRRFKSSFPGAFSWVFRGAQVLPDWLYYRIFA